MARQKSIAGRCALCGEEGRITFEHVPPEAAFNDERVMLADIHQLLGSNRLLGDDGVQGRYQQRGAGAYTLCERCNNNTGAWYAREYVRFVHVVFPLALSVPTGESISFSFPFKPLPLLKQIATMFCSACGPSFADAQPAIRRFILNREERGLPPKLSFHLGLFDVHSSKASRQSGITGRLTGQHMEVFSEISFPPLNAVMSCEGGPPDGRLYDITWFSRYDLREQTQVLFKLYNLPVNSYFPGDYRTRAEIVRQAKEP